MSAKKESTAKKTATTTKSKSKKTKTTPQKHDKKLIKELTDSLAQSEEKALRLRAEFDNFRKRKEQEIQKIYEYNGETIFKDLLPIVDDIERLADAVSDGESDKKLDSLIKGIELIQKRLNRQLEEWKLVPFAEPGDTLDPELHDAMMVQSDPEKEENQILQVFEKGYQYKDRILRHAKVIVNKK